MRLPDLSSYDSELPTPVTYEEFAEDPHERFEIAVTETDGTPKLSRRKRVGEYLEDNTDLSIGSMNTAAEFMTGMTGGVVGSYLSTGNPSLLTGLFIGTGFAMLGRSTPNSQNESSERKLGSYLQESSGDIRASSGEIDKIKDALSDPEERANDLYGLGFGEHFESINSDERDEIIDELVEEYPEAEWRLRKDEGNPFQVLGVEIDEGPNYDRRKRIADELGRDVLETPSGRAPTSREHKYDVVIVDRNP